MNFYATTSVSSLSLAPMNARILKQCEKARSPVHHAMSTQFRQCVYDNFGSTGMYRPHQWAMLSPAYARKVKRQYATLNVSGTLRAAIKRTSNEDKGTVSISTAACEYALAHQFGSEKINMPARPYFPMFKDGTILMPVKYLVIKAAQLALKTFWRVSPDDK